MSLWRRTCGRSDWSGVYARAPAAQEGYDRAMRLPWMLVGLGLLAAGAVWVAQGLNLPFAPGSFMTAQPMWVVIGLAAMAAGVAALRLARRPSR